MEEAVSAGPDVLGWEEVFNAGPEVCGGKALGLARLHRYGFRVPRGGVITARAYQELLEGVPGEARAAVAAAPAAGATDPAIVSALEAIRASIESAPLPVPLVSALAHLISRCGLDDAWVAVRSSATAEDSAQASFAGIHRSFLNVRGLEAIGRAILGCYASLWTPQALAYRRRMNFLDDDVLCAVVICEMVHAPGRQEPHTAGVAFTVDPLTGRRDLIVVDAAPGLGEAVVGGTVEPQHVVFRDTGAGIVAHDRSAGPPLLPLEREIELAHVLVRVHWALGDGQEPQDVEWAFDGHAIWLLQARPATNVRRCLPAALASLPRYWSTANIKEAVPGVVSLLSWSLIKGAVERIAFAGAIVSGYELPAGTELVRRFDGRGYFDLTLMQWILYDAMGVTPAQTVQAIGGHQPEIPVPGNPMTGASGRRRALAQMKMLGRIWRIDAALSTAVTRQDQLLREIQGVHLSGVAPSELSAMLAALLNEHEQLDVVVGLANAASGPWELALEKLLTPMFGGGARPLLGRLLTGTREVISAEHGYAILQLAGAAREDPAARTWIDSDAPATSWIDLPEASRFKQELARFLDLHGHRAVYEADVLNPRWAEDPAYIVDEVRRIVHSGQPRATHRAAAAIRTDAERQLRQRAGWRAPIVFWLVRRLRRAMAAREAGKSALVASLLPSKRIALEIGRRLTESGHLREPGQILHLAIADLLAWLEGRWDGQGASALADDRAGQRLTWLSQDAPPDVIVEDPQGQVSTLAAPTARDGDTWRGIGAAPGQARGVVRIVRHPNDARDFADGEVLVAPSTDPGWTPLFLRASAIVMETGGYLSHGAIVAREYGIPAVVNLPGILGELLDGDRIFVDGDLGRVIRES
jgi:pyruvate,water dikinase